MAAFNDWATSHLAFGGPAYGLSICGRLRLAMCPDKVFEESWPRARYRRRDPGRLGSILGEDADGLSSAVLGVNCAGRNAIEPVIEYPKSDGPVEHNRLLRAHGQAINTILAAASLNRRLLAGLAQGFVRPPLGPSLDPA
jgi:hypothetical protein